MMVAHCINLIYFNITVSQILSYSLRECWSVQVIVKVDQLNSSGNSIFFPLQELVCGLYISGTIDPLSLKITNFITNNVKKTYGKKSVINYLSFLSQYKLQSILVYLKRSTVRTVSAQMTLKQLYYLVVIPSQKIVFANLNFSVLVNISEIYYNFFG